MKQLVKILDNIQKGEAEHFKGLQSIHKLYHKNESKFKEEFIPLLQRILVTAQNDASVDRIISFIAKFTAKQEANDDLIDFLLGYLIDTTLLQDKTIRLRSCQLIASILSTLPSDAEINDDIWEKLSKRMVPRLRDKVPSIRVQAVKALTRLQDPHDEEDSVICGYLALLANDSNKEVRKTVLKNIASSLTTLPCIITRTRDTSPDVRVIVYKLLSDIPVKQLDIDQRVAVLHNGLTDGEANVKKACVSMLCNGWLKSQDDDPVKLLNFLLVEKYEELAEKVIKLILRNCDVSWTPPKVKRNALPILSAESALVWRVYLASLKKRLKKEPDVQNLLDKSAPAIPEFCLLLKAYVSNESIAKQLVGMVGYLDLTDEAGRRELSDVLLKFLPSSKVAESVKKSIMKVLKLLHTDEDTYISMILEIISEIQDPLEASQVVQEEVDPGKKRRASFVRGPSSFNLRSSSTNLRASITESPPMRRAATAGVMQSSPGEEVSHDGGLSSPASTKLSDLRAQRSALAKKKDEYGVERLDKEIAILEEMNEDEKFTTEERRWVHCMALTEDLLQLTTKDLQNPGIHDLLGNVILRYITHTNPRIRERAMRCLGLFCMLSKDVARTYLYLFSQALQNDVRQIQCVVLKLLFDLLLVYGMDGFEEIESSQKSPEKKPEVGNSSEIVNILCTCLLNESAELRAIVVEGFCKLMYGDQFSDSKILSKLIVLFFLTDPAELDKKAKTKDDSALMSKDTSPYAHVRQCLSVFLPAYSFQSLEHMYCILAAFIPTIREIVYNMGQYLHGPDDDVQIVTVGRVAQLFIHLTITHPKDGDSCPHNELAIKLAKEIIADPKDPDYLKLCRVFKELQLSNHPASIKTLKFFIETLIEKVKYTSYSKILAKFLEDLQKLDPVPEIEPTATALANLREELEHHATERQAYVDALNRIPHKRRVRHTHEESSENDSEGDYDDKSEKSSVPKRQVPARQSKKEANGKMEEISMNMRSLKKELKKLAEASDEEGEESASEEEGGKGKRKRAAKRSGKQAKVKHEEEDGEEEEEDGKDEESAEEDEDTKQSGKSRGAKRAPKNQIVILDSDEEEEEEEEKRADKSRETNKNSPTKRSSARNKRTPNYATKKESDDEDEDDDEEEDESDYEDSPKKSPQKSPPKNASKSRPKRRKEEEEEKSEESETDRKSKRTKVREIEVKTAPKRKRSPKKGDKAAESDDASSDPPVAAKKPRTTKKGKKESDESEENSEKDERESEKKVGRGGGRAKSGASKAKGTKKGKKEESDDEAEDSEDVEMTDAKNSTRSSTATTRSSSGGKRAARKAAQGNSESEEESEEELRDARKTRGRAQGQKKSRENGRGAGSGSDDESDLRTREETARNTRRNAMTPALSHTNRVVVAFGEDTTQAEASKLAVMIQQLHGTVYTGTSLYSAEITHVVEKKDPTTKMLFAIVSNRWLISPEWIKDSAAHGAFLNENEYGVKCKNPIDSQAFYLDSSITDGDKRRVQLIKSLIKVGKGSIVETAGEADIVLVGPGAQGKGKGKKKSGEGQVFQWDEFVCFLRENR